MSRREPFTNCRDGSGRKIEIKASSVVDGQLVLQDVENGVTIPRIERQEEDTSMKRSVARTLSCAAVLVLLAASTLDNPALAGELEGVTLANTLKAGEKTLKLNGLGLRKKAMFKVYVGGLYLESPSKDAGAILASDQAKAIRLHFLRDLTKGQLVEAFQEGFDANAKDKAPQKAAFEKMLGLVPDVKAGSTLTFTYLPGKGTTLQVGSNDLGVFEGKGFADAVFSIWLGSKPPSEDLKKGMLG
jgi:hypothetical protein